MTEVRAEVERRRTSDGYPADLLARLQLELEIRPETEPLDALASLQLHRSVLRRGGVRGGAAFQIKRAIRRAIAWYVLPMLDDQVRFNRAVGAEVRRLEGRIGRVEPPGSACAARPRWSPASRHRGNYWIAGSRR